jgi:outer membrane biosynthesis protein TonB
MLAFARQRDHARGGVVARATTDVLATPRARRSAAIFDHGSTMRLQESPQRVRETSQRLILSLSITFAACSPIKEPSTRPATEGLCASGRRWVKQAVSAPLLTIPSVKSIVWSDCPFPDEADTKGIDSAETPIQVLVAPDGAPTRVRILADPGYGFAEAAVRCVSAMTFVPAYDANCTAVSAWTPLTCMKFYQLPEDP